MKTSREIAEFIAIAPDGGMATLDGSDLPTTGYLVSGLVCPLLVDDSTTIEDTESFIDYLRTLPVITHVRWWTDDEGVTWVDGFDHTAAYIDAECSCRSRRVETFYAIQEGKSWAPILV